MPPPANCEIVFRRLATGSGYNGDLRGKPVVNVGEKGQPKGSMPVFAYFDFALTTPQQIGTIAYGTSPGRIDGSNRNDGYLPILLDQVLGNVPIGTRVLVQPKYLATVQEAACGAFATDPARAQNVINNIAGSDQSQDQLCASFWQANKTKCTAAPAQSWVGQRICAVGGALRWYASTQGAAAGLTVPGSATSGVASGGVVGVVEAQQIIPNTPSTVQAMVGITVYRITVIKNGQQVTRWFDGRDVKLCTPAPSGGGGSSQEQPSPVNEPNNTPPPTGGGGGMNNTTKAVFGIGLGLLVAYGLSKMK